MVYLLARLLPAASGLATVMILSRLFSPAVYGRYALVLGASGITLMVLSSWLRECALRFYPQEKQAEAEDGLLLRVAALAVLFSLIPLLLFAVLRIIPGALAEYRDLGFWATTWIVVGLLSIPLSGTLRAGLQVRSYVLWESLRALVGVALVVAFIVFLQKPIHWAFIAMAVASFSSALGMGWTLGLVSRLKQGWRTRSRSALRVPEILRYGLPLAGWAIGVEILSLADRFVIEWFHGSEAVGIYASNYYLAEGGTALLLASVLAAAKPRIMHGALETGTEAPPPLLSTVTRLVVLLLLPAITATAVLGRQMAVVFLDPEYIQGYVVLPIIVAGAGLWCLGELGQTTLQLAGRTQTLLGGVLGCAALNVLLNLAVVPRWGYVGAAWTTLVSYLMYPILVHWASRRVSRWAIPWASLLRGALASLLLGGLLVLIWRMEICLGARIAMACLTPAVYLAVLAALGEPLAWDILRWIGRAVGERIQRRGKEG